MTNKTLISTLLSISMFAAAAVPSFAETVYGIPKTNISVITSINGNGLKTESVNGEIKTTVLTDNETVELTKDITQKITENISGIFSTPVLTTVPEKTSSPTAKPVLVASPESAATPAMSMEDAVNINVFQIIKDYIEYYVQQYVSEVLDEKKGE